MLLLSSARLSCGKDQPMCLTWLDESPAWVWRKSLFYEFTISACNSPLLKPFYGDLHGRFPWFAPMRLPFTSQIVEPSRYLPHIFDDFSCERVFAAVLLQGMQNTLTEQRESCTPIPHPFDELELVHFSLHQSVVLR